VYGFYTYKKVYGQKIRLEIVGFSLQTHNINYFLLGFPFIVISLFNEYIILFRNLLKLVYPLADFRIVLILELAPSIGPLERRFPWYLMKEFFILSFQWIRSLPKVLNSSCFELINSSINYSNSSSQVS
jgi:hypothetical protein